MLLILARGCIRRRNNHQRVNSRVASDPEIKSRSLLTLPSDTHYNNYAELPCFVQRLPSLPLRSTVGQPPLERHIGVRIPEGQPYFRATDSRHLVFLLVHFQPLIDPAENARFGSAGDSLITTGRVLERG